VIVIGNQKLFVRFVAADPVAWSAHFDLLSSRLVADLENLRDAICALHASKGVTTRNYRRSNTPRRSAAKERGPVGIFKSAYLLLKQEKVYEATSRLLKDELAWFEQHLVVPKLSSTHRRAKFWFRSEAEEMIERAWAMTLLLKDHGLPVTQHTADDPGEIIYEDQYQIAAIPRGAGVKGGTKRR
jgi:hypothetical protein